MRTPITRVAAVFLLAALAGCTGLSGAPPPSIPAANAVTRSTEQGGRFITLVGPRRAHADPFLGVPGTNFTALRSSIDTRTGESVHQLYVEDSYFGAERNWEAARDPAGQALRFIAISKNQITCDNGCSYAEEFAAGLPEALLRANAQGKLAGLAISFTARSGARQTIIVPGDLIAKQLAAIDEARATLPTAAAAPPPANPPR
jgi:hypothetical protein